MKMTPTTHLIRNHDVVMLQIDVLSRFCNITHFITTRHGGISSGNYSSMNAGAFSGDAREKVEENRCLLADAVGFRKDLLFAPAQVHGAEVRVLDDNFLRLDENSRSNYLQGIDGVITATPGVCVAVTTADCVPVLLYAPDKNVVAAVHAGWRGTVKDIVSKAIGIMVGDFGCDAAEMVAGIGPAISLSKFEVGNEVVDAFAASGNWTEAEMGSIVSCNPATGKAHIDLCKANALLLMKAGLSASSIGDSGICTHTNYHDFFSARRLGINSGRILSGIFLR